MLQVRSALQEDEARIRELWRICFGDSEAFMNWFFANRFFPEFSSVLEEDGVIMSALQSYPLHVRLRGEILPASMMAGVSTDPAGRGRGYMRQILLHYLKRLNALHVPIVFHTPAHLTTFFSRGHYPATDTQHLTIEGARAERMPEGVSRQSMCAGLGPLLVCYYKATRAYSGCVSRTMGDFIYKFQDYASDGGKCLVHRTGGDVRGYCVYYVMEEAVHAEECFALDAETLRLLIEALRHEAAGRKLHVKLPPDVSVNEKDAVLETKPQGVMGITDISAILSAIVRDSSFIFEVLDASVPENAGIWDGMGRVSRREPHIRIQAGRLGQFLDGYRSLAELMEAGEAEIIDTGAAKALDDRFPKQICFVTDEY